MVVYKLRIMRIVWMNLPWLTWLVLGNTALCVALINRLHALNLHEKRLKQLRHGHDLLLCAFPIALFVLAGITTSPWADSTVWHRLPMLVLLYASVCSVASLAVLGVFVLRLLRRLPRQQIALRSRRYDIAEQLGYRPVGESSYKLLTWIPGNELLQLEISEKEFALPRLPAAWDGLRVLHLSDLHLIGCPDLPYYERVIELACELRPDLVVFTGDLLDRQELQAWLTPTLGRISSPPSSPPPSLGCYFILGNHDANFTEPDQTRKWLINLGWQDVAGRSVVVRHADSELVICGSETPWMGQQPSLSETPTDAFRLLLSHTPDNLHWARGQEIDLMLSGHNHGGQVRLPGFGPVFSPSIHGGEYAAGTFWEVPTLLHVSRGIGAQHPLRWNCPPEVSLLILRPAADAVEVPCVEDRELVLKGSAA